MTTAAIITLRRRHIGGGKHYDTLEAVAAGCKAFAGLDPLMDAQVAA